MSKTIAVSTAYWITLAWGAGATLLALWISALFFPKSLLLAATGLTSVALIFQMNNLLVENRDAIWIHHRSSWEANFTLTCKVVAVFAGAFLVTIACQALAPALFLDPLELPKSGLFSNQRVPLFLHNLRVLLACLCLAFIYRAAGILLVINWNAMNWSTSLLTFIRSATEAGRGDRAGVFDGGWLYAPAVVPHLVLEAAAYITAGMAGVFLSKGLFKYKLSSGKFLRVSRACVAILVASVGCLWLAMELEVGLAQAVLASLIRKVP